MVEGAEYLPWGLAGNAFKIYLVMQQTAIPQAVAKDRP
jgi:hypothetical protein